MNMSYCRFQNTLTDLKDCLNEMYNADTIKDMELSKEEKFAMLTMYRYCEDFMSEVDRLIPQEEDE